MTVGLGWLHIELWTKKTFKSWLYFFGQGDLSFYHWNLLLEVTNRIFKNMTLLFWKKKRICWGTPCLIHKSWGLIFVLLDSWLLIFNLSRTWLAMVCHFPDCWEVRNLFYLGVFKVGRSCKLWCAVERERYGLPSGFLTLNYGNAPLKIKWLIHLIVQRISDFNSNTTLLNIGCKSQSFSFMICSLVCFL